MYKPKSIYFIVCNGISDIGKGWLVSSIGAINPKKCLPIKIDPLLNLNFPQNLGENIHDICVEEDVSDFIGNREGMQPADYIISEDFRSYRNVGMRILPECNIIGGRLIYDFLRKKNVKIRPNEIKKNTFSDLSSFLADKISNIARKLEPDVLLIEVGGTIGDAEHIYIPGAARMLQNDNMLGVVPEILLLSFFEYSEVNREGAYRIKTQYIRGGIRIAQEKFYGLPLKACFARRRNVPSEVSDHELENELHNIAYETQMKHENMLVVPNVSWDKIHILSSMISKIGLVEE